MYLKPKKSLGQNFLVDKNILQKIVAACSINYDDQVLEIGPGSFVVEPSTKRLALLQATVCLPLESPAPR